jgi:hypothetical protein
MLEHSGAAGLSSYLTRGRCDAQVWGDRDWRAVNTFLLHPNTQNINLVETFRVNPNSVDRVEMIEISSGVQILFNNDWVNGFVGMPVPPAAMINTEEWRMWTNMPALNEFGYFYVALFLAGNYARYFPDKWLQDVETSSPLALAIEELCTISEWRVPWLALTELEMTLFVNED